MPFNKTEKIWMNGKFVNWDDAKIHVLSHVVHYGSGLFEGIRCYKTPKGPAIFRLKEHTKRLVSSCKIYRIEIPYSEDEINNAIIKTIKTKQILKNPQKYHKRTQIARKTRKNPLNHLPVNIVIRSLLGRTLSSVI